MRTKRAGSWASRACRSPSPADRPQLLSAGRLPSANRSLLTDSPRNDDGLGVALLAELEYLLAAASEHEWITDLEPDHVPRCS